MFLGRSSKLNLQQEHYSGSNYTHWERFVDIIYSIFEGMNFLIVNLFKNFLII